MWSSPFHVGNDLSISDIVSRVDALPDNLEISPADCMLFTQTDAQSILEHNVGFIPLDTHTHTHF